MSKPYPNHGGRDPVGNTQMWLSKKSPQLSTNSHCQCQLSCLNNRVIRPYPDRPLHGFLLSCVTSGNWKPTNDSRTNDDPQRSLIAKSLDSLFEACPLLKVLDRAWPRNPKQAASAVPALSADLGTPRLALYPAFRFSFLSPVTKETEMRFRTRRQWDAFRLRGFYRVLGIAVAVTYLCPFESTLQERCKLVGIPCVFLKRQKPGPKEPMGLRRRKKECERTSNGRSC